MFWIESTVGTTVGVRDPIGTVLMVPVLPVHLLPPYTRTLFSLVCFPGLPIMLRKSSIMGRRGKHAISTHQGKQSGLLPNLGFGQ